jgi:hypothetical protein
MLVGNEDGRIMRVVWRVEGDQGRVGSKMSFGAPWGNDDGEARGGFVVTGIREACISRDLDCKENPSTTGS